MTNRPIDDSRCAHVSDLLADFALGTLIGAERSEVLAHVSECSNCAAKVDSLTRTADALLELAPNVEAPLGFESRVMDRFRSEVPVTNIPRQSRVFAVAAAIIFLVVVAFGAGALIGQRGSTNYSSATSYPASARLASQGHNVGQVFVSNGRPAWIYMSVDDDSWSGVAICTVRYRDGHVEKVGQFRLSNGYGSWAATLKSPASQVTSVQVVGAHGHVLASAKFSA